MARKLPPARPTSFHEPLWARKSYVAWRDKPPVIPAGTDAEGVAKILAEHEDGARFPSWVVWGTALFDPEVSLVVDDTSGEPVPGGGVICTISRCQGFHSKTVSPEHFAKRFVECVNAFQGIANPSALMADLGRLLARIVFDESEDYGDVADALLARMQKPVFDEGDT